MCRAVAVPQHEARPHAAGANASGCGFFPNPFAPSGAKRGLVVEPAHPLLFQRLAAPKHAVGMHKKTKRRSIVGGRTLLRAAATAIAVACASAAFAQSAGLASTGEYIVGFVQYVRWPAEDDIKTWHVCVGSRLTDKAAYDGRSARGKTFAVRSVAANDGLADCQILDLTDAAPADTKALLARARRLAILTVGEGEAFCTAGGIACLRSRHEASGFEINLTAVQRARLNVSAQLLMLGRKRQPEGGAR